MNELNVPEADLERKFEEAMINQGRKMDSVFNLFEERGHAAIGQCNTTVKVEHVAVE